MEEVDDEAGNGPKHHTEQNVRCEEEQKCEFQELVHARASGQ
ncbi:Unknown protein sequence [Pseudomonas amygdali pv. lachrymans]|nr:Unknown protein sequence [Pseudomonas amygdali pv. lachrymans]